MPPIIPKPPITPAQKRAALAVAVIVDLIQMGGFLAFFEGFLSPFEDILDVLTALILIAICGFKWQFIVAFVVELFPFVDIFPTWTALVLTLTTVERADAPPPPVNVSAAVPPPMPAQPGGKNVVVVQAVTVPPMPPPLP